MTEHEQLVELCERLGAPSAQAQVMARQLAKRADQLSAERGIPRLEALSHLLQVLVKGRNGEGPEGPAEPAGSTPPSEPPKNS